MMILACLLLLVIGVASARAEGPYSLDKSREWMLIGGGAALGVGALLMIDGVDPLTPRRSRISIQTT